MNFFRNLLKRAGESQVGAISAEYVAILLVIAGIVAVVIGLGIDERVDECGTAAVDGMFSEGDEPEC